MLPEGLHTDLHDKVSDWFKIRSNKGAFIKGCYVYDIDWVFSNKGKRIGIMDFKYPMDTLTWTMKKEFKWELEHGQKCWVVYAYNLKGKDKKVTDDGVRFKVIEYILNDKGKVVEGERTEKFKPRCLAIWRDVAKPEQMTMERLKRIIKCRKWLHLTEKKKDKTKRLITGISVIG